VTTRRKVILSIIGIIAFLYLGVYTVLTPFIRGVVVDETTKQPVENAWVMATASIGSRTVAGDVGGARAISHRHLRTGKDGVFYIFPKLYLSFPTPFTFGTMKKNLNLTVRVMDGKRAEVNLTNDWWKRFIFMTVHTKQDERNFEELRSELRNLFTYCKDGLFFPVYRYGSQICDAWELDYTIVVHENLIKKLDAPRNTKQDAFYAGAMGALVNLYERKGDYKKALEALITARDVEKKYKSDLSRYQQTIDVIEEKLKKNNNSLKGANL